MMNSWIKSCMSGLFSNEHLALQFLAPQTICNSVVSQLNVAFLIQSVLFFININTFNYPDPRLSGLFRLVPTSPDKRGSTVYTSRLREVKKVFRRCHLRHSWISDVSEDIYIWKLEKDKEISPNWFFKYNPNMPGFARSGWRNYPEQMCSLQVPRIWNHQPFWTCTKQTYWIFIIDSQEKISHDNNSL